MKSISLLFLFIITAITTLAQNSFNYHLFSIGAGYGVTTTYPPSQSLTNSMAYNLNLSYHVSPFYAITAETQIGNISGGGTIAGGDIKAFTNSYYAITLHTDLQAGELINYANSAFLNSIKNLYIGTGLGLLANNTTVVTLNNTNFALYTLASNNIIVPLRTGYEFKIFNGYNQPQFRLDISYTYNTVFGKGLDGNYNPYSHSSIKYYNYWSAGLKYGFGATKLYHKAIDASQL